MVTTIAIAFISGIGTGLLFNIPKIWHKPEEIYEDGKYWDTHEIAWDYEKDDEGTKEKVDDIKHPRPSHPQESMESLK